MKNFKPNELSRKLDELAEIPDAFHFDEEAVWRKIEIKLGHVPKRRNNLGVTICLATFCILIFTIEFLSFYFLAGNPDSGLMTNKRISQDKLFARTSTYRTTLKISALKSRKQPVKKSKNLNIISPTISPDSNLNYLGQKKVDTIASLVIAIETSDSIRINRKFPIAHYNELEPAKIYTSPYKTKVKWIYKKKFPVMVYGNDEFREQTIRIKGKKRNREISNLN